MSFKYTIYLFIFLQKT